MPKKIGHKSKTTASASWLGKISDRIKMAVIKLNEKTDKIKLIKKEIRG